MKTKSSSKSIDSQSVGERERNAVESIEDIESNFESLDDIDLNAVSPPRSQKVSPGLSTQGDSTRISREDDTNDSALELNNKAAKTKGEYTNGSDSNTLVGDLDKVTLEILDEGYEHALEEQDIIWNSRFISVRQNAAIGLWFVAVYVLTGTLVFHSSTNWTIPESLLFTIYSITTVGYGSLIVPDRPSIHIFIVFYILVGIATMTIIATQMYEYINVQASRAHNIQDKLDLAKRRGEMDAKKSKNYNVILTNSNSNSSRTNTNVLPEATREKFTKVRLCFEISVDKVMRFYQALDFFLTTNKYGKIISVPLPFIVLIGIGAAVVGPIQNWNFTQSLYFSVVSLTTVGYGEFYPTRSGSIWFCIFWLPFSIGFMSLYLGNIARFYLKVSREHILRIERRIRQKNYEHKQSEKMEKSKAIARLNSGGFDLSVHEDLDDTNSLKISTAQDPPHISKKILHNDMDADQDTMTKSANEFRMIGSTESRMKTMRDVLNAIKNKFPKEGNLNPISTQMTSEDTISSIHHDIFILKSIKRYNAARGDVEKKPSLALRVLVQERIAKIIAHEIAGQKSRIEIHRDTLKITLDGLNRSADKYYIPRRARKAFRSVAFQALYFVGERGLIYRGADALFDLKPEEFNGLFSPIVVAIGDTDAMTTWLECTQDIAELEFERLKNSPASLLSLTRLRNEATDGSVSDNAESDFVSVSHKTGKKMQHIFV
mmetsp:Transcript_3469/g.4830  ORF Transcript_3469/g.4830 Transcript_3469/m.4830 type:complete len:716 (+) Transcript_3469:35-2182(+)